MTSPAHIRPLDPSSDDEVTVVATRMREMLVEVVGQARGASMYTMDWLVDRVRWHLGQVDISRLDGEPQGNIGSNPPQPLNPLY